MSDRGSISGNEGKGRLRSEEGAETPPFFIYTIRAGLFVNRWKNYYSSTITLFKSNDCNK